MAVPSTKRKKLLHHPPKKLICSTTTTLDDTSLVGLFPPHLIPAKVGVFVDGASIANGHKLWVRYLHTQTRPEKIRQQRVARHAGHKLGEDVIFRSLFVPPKNSSDRGSCATHMAALGMGTSASSSISAQQREMFYTGGGGGGRGME